MNALATIAAALVLAIPSSTAGIGPATIEVTGRQIMFRTVDVGGHGATPGDTEVTRSILYDRHARQIGRRELVCTVIWRANRNCRGTYFFPRGTIVVGGSLTSRQYYTLAVLGGTRLYDNARGSLLVTRLESTEQRDTVLIQLVG